MALADREKVVNDADLRQIVARMRETTTDAALTATTTAAAPDFSLTPAESGYGHGV